MLCLSVDKMIFLPFTLICLKTTSILVLKFLMGTLIGELNTALEEVKKSVSKSLNNRNKSITFTGQLHLLPVTLGNDILLNI